MIQLHFDENQLNIGKSTGVLHLFAWNYINYANMESFRRDSHIYFNYWVSLHDRFILLIIDMSRFLIISNIKTTMDIKLIVI